MALAAIAAAGLFIALEARRSALSESALVPATDYAVASTGQVPELALPWADQGYDAEDVGPNSYPAAPAYRIGPALDQQAATERFTPRIPRRSAPSFVPGAPSSPPVYAIDNMPAAPNRSGETVVPSPASPGNTSSSSLLDDNAPDQDARAQAGRLINPADTVPKGTIIQAVMETALDSTRAGFARAIVSRDIRGFDGTRVLIPRGSRLYGEYKADVEQGQSRATIEWQRLLRPDGVIIVIASPAADPLGRAGLKGKVNSHFFERFGGAILQSVLDIGVGLATRTVNDRAVVLAFPQTSLGAVAQPAGTVRPTLTIKEGTSVSVYVARDLDFSTVRQ